MVFNSLTYAIFFVVVLAIYHSSRHRAQNAILLIASYVFYGWWDLRFLFLIALSTTFDYWAGLLINNGYLTKREKLLPAISLSCVGFVSLGISYGGTLTSPRLGIETLQLAYLCGGLAIFIVAAGLFYRLASAFTGERRRTLVLVASICQNLVILGFFKYFNFFISSAATALEAIGFEAHLTTLYIALPIGVSFYTFQSISYSIEVYQRKVAPSSRFLDFALFVSYFPQLVAGPISRASALLPQILSARAVTYDQISSGIFLILFGLFKKVGIADGLSRPVDQLFSATGAPAWADVMAGTFYFAIQIYCDFSGYSDIARGSSKLLGIELIVNFNLPYFSRNPQEFWRRWHISLSNWLRDYLYIPLGGNRGSTIKVYATLMTTMILGGLWHGAAWNFVLWGFYQGLMLCVHRAITPSGSRVPGTLAASSAVNPAVLLLRVIQTGLFFGAVCYGWLLFRSGSLPQIVQFTAILLQDFGNLHVTISTPRLSSLIGIPVLAAIELAQFATGDHDVHRRLALPLRGALFALLTALLIMGMSNESTQFIYFQF